MTYIVMGLPGCNYCVRAMNLLKGRKLPLQYINIDEEPLAKEKILSEGHVTVPQVYTVDAVGVEKHIGGHDELMKHLKKITH